MADNLINYIIFPYNDVWQHYFLMYRLTINGNWNIFKIIFSPTVWIPDSVKNNWKKEQTFWEGYIQFFHSNVWTCPLLSLQTFNVVLWCSSKTRHWTVLTTQDSFNDGFNPDDCWSSTHRQLDFNEFLGDVSVLIQAASLVPSVVFLELLRHLDRS